MDNDMLSFVLSHLPNEWEDVPVYTKNYNLFTLFNHSDEYQKIETHFYGANISQIIRVQNPFHYGRYMLRQEMLGTNFEVNILDLIIIIIYNHIMYFIIYCRIQFFTQYIVMI